jgi:hypothetical protein
MARIWLPLPPPPPVAVGILSSSSINLTCASVVSSITSTESPNLNWILNKSMLN